MDVLELAKRFIERGDLPGFQQAFADLQTDVEVTGSIDWPWLFQKVYLHACLKGQRPIAEWLHDAVFPTIDPIGQIGIRQGFAYGRHLLETAERRAHERQKW